MFLFWVQSVSVDSGSQKTLCDLPALFVYLYLI